MIDQARIYTRHSKKYPKNLMATLKELIAQKEALERQIEETRAQERAETITKIRALMTENGLSLADLVGRGAGKTSGKKSTAPGKKVAAKYRNAVTGDTWSGRGLQPKSLKAALSSGKKIEEFLV